MISGCACLVNCTNLGHPLLIEPGKQQSVEYADIKANTLREEDIKVISKLVNLKALHFQGPSSPGAAPAVWRTGGTRAEPLVDKPYSSRTPLGHSTS
jgi:hypothetical protein